MMRLGRNELVYGRDVPVEEVEARIDAVDREAVARVAAAVLDPRTRGLCVLGPLADGSIRFSTQRAA
jgi:predicted Zn-dependent peptidase